MKNLFRKAKKKLYIYVCVCVSVCVFNLILDLVSIEAKAD